MLGLRTAGPKRDALSRETAALSFGGVAARGLPEPRRRRNPDSWPIVAQSQRDCILQPGVGPPWGKGAAVLPRGNVGDRSSTLNELHPSGIRDVRGLCRPRAPLDQLQPVRQRLRVQWVRVRAHIAFALALRGPSKEVSAPLFPASHRTPKPRGNSNGSGRGPGSSPRLTARGGGRNGGYSSSTEDR